MKVDSIRYSSLNNIIIYIGRSVYEYQDMALIKKVRTFNILYLIHFCFIILHYIIYRGINV